MNLVSLFHCDMLLKVLLYSTKLSMNYKFIIKKASQSITSYELYMVESKGFAPLGRLKKIRILILARSANSTIPTCTC